MRGYQLIIAAAIAFHLPASAFAEPPAVKFLSAPLVTPPNAWSFYGSRTTHTTGAAAGVTRPAKIRELARGIGRGGAVTGDAYAARVFDYVRNNIDTDFQFGLAKGAYGAVIDQAGTPFDQAHLMVELLREGGVAASYQIGTITLDASQFGRWTGLVTGLNQSAQTFTVDAQAACQLLSGGGIPATVNNQTSCTGLSGNLTTVTVGHIWVAANGKLYDPSFKQHVLKTGVDLAAAMGCGTASAPTCGTNLINAAIVNSSTTLKGLDTSVGANYVQNVNTSQLNSSLNQMAVSIENYIQGSDRYAKAEDVVGGKIRDLDYNPTISSSLPYASVIQYTVTGDIPDQYRTKLTVTFDNINQTVFVDESYGAILAIVGSVNTSDSSRSSALVIERDSPVLTVLARSTRSGATETNDTVWLAANHPYAAKASPSMADGSYGDETIVLETALDAQVTDTGQRIFWPALVLNGWGGAGFGQQALMADLASVMAPVVNGNFCVSYNAPLECYRFDRTIAVAAAAWLAQSSRIRDLATAMNGASALNHHSVGLVSATGQSRLLNVQTSLSIASTSAQVGDRRALSISLTAPIAAMESSVLSELYDSPSYSSTTELFSVSNLSQHRYYEATASNISSILATSTNYDATEQSRILAYFADTSLPYTLVLPKNGNAGSIVFPGEGSLVIGSNGIVGYTPSLDRIAYTTSYGLKGGGGASPPEPFSEAMKSIDNGKAAARKIDYSVNLSDGNLTWKPPADLTVGGGAGALEFQRFYSSRDVSAPNYIQISGPAPLYKPTPTALLGAGWTHNNDVKGSIGSDTRQALGADSALDAASSIAVLYALRTLNLPAVSLNSQVTGIFAMNWWLSQLGANSVVVRRPPNTAVFMRLPSGAYNPPPGTNAMLTRSGADRTQHLLSTGLVYDYRTLSFILTSDEEIINFENGTIGHGTNFNAIAFQPHLKAINIAKSSGIRESFSYSFDSTVEMYKYPQLSAVVNSAGNSLNFSGTMSNYVVANGSRTVSLSTPGVVSPAYSTISNPLGNVTKYDIKDDVYNSQYWSIRTRITDIFKASDATNPVLKVNWDGIRRLSSVDDRFGRRSDYYVGSVSDEIYRIGEKRDAGGQITKERFDKDGRLLERTDELGRVIRNAYDNAGRLIKTVNPEGDAVEFSYDVRSNRTRECRIAKGALPVGRGCDPSQDMITSTVYLEAPAVWVCAIIKTCNKPSYEIDARGNRTDYTWSSTHGQLLTVQGPADALGVRPLTTYGYTTFTGTDGATFYLLTSKQEKLDAANTRTTTWAYNGSAAKFTLKEQVVDSGGLALRTCFKFDTVGNLISKTEPKAGLVSCP